jgi:tRNA(His) 5'-end guanylyltransferase
MLMLQKGINWNDTPTVYKRGCACIRQEREIETPNGIAIRNKWVIDTEMPILTQDRNYLERFLKGE